MEEKWQIMGRPLSEVLAEAEELKEAGERRILSVEWLPGEYWGKNNDIATRDSVGFPSGAYFVNAGALCNRGNPGFGWPELTVIRPS
jgi:hypothetical protein